MRSSIFDLNWSFLQFFLRFLNYLENSCWEIQIMTCPGTNYRRNFLSEQHRVRIHRINTSRQNRGVQTHKNEETKHKSWLKKYIRNFTHNLKSYYTCNSWSVYSLLAIIVITVLILTVGHHCCAENSTVYYFEGINNIIKYNIMV